MQKPGGRGGTDLRERLDRRVGEHGRSVRARRRVAEQLAACSARKVSMPLVSTGGVYSPRHRQHVLAGDLGLDVAAAQDGVERRSM